MNELLHNKAIIIPIIVIIVTQICKVIYFAIKERKFSLSMFLTDGGMPSSHSAFVAALATVVGIEHSLSSTLFAITIIFAIIIMHDASGIRYAAGKHAVILNKILEENKTLAESLDEDNEKLIELLGHTKLQVYVGAIIGIILALIIYQII